MSTCIRRQVGAVAVRNRRSFADAFNGNIPGEQHCDEGGCLYCTDAIERKLAKGAGSNSNECVCCHAESNLVSYCAVEGISLRGATVYSTDKPCVHCTKLLASSGIVQVVYDVEWATPDWTDHLTAMTLRKFGEERDPGTVRVLSNVSLHQVSLDDQPGLHGGRLAWDRND